MPRLLKLKKLKQKLNNLLTNVKKHNCPLGLVVFFVLIAGFFVVRYASAVPGVNWTLATGAASWQGRMSPSSLVFQNKMWLMGGRYDFGTYFSDVWSSSDGVNWTQAIATAPWNKWNHESVVFLNKMWVIGGQSSGTLPSDVWYSQ